jgi:haloacetate dehalogenase
MGTDESSKSLSRRALLLAGVALVATTVPLTEADSGDQTLATAGPGSNREGETHVNEVTLEGFEYRRITTAGAKINVASRGKGAPLLLLHGYPETHLMWQKVAPMLAEEFTVVCADLRGYGDSSKPEGAADHSNYSKRAMAADMIEVMAALGYREFFVAGHDRGGRVGYRLALDHPAALKRLALLDIVSTKAVYEQVTTSLATAYFHWFFLIQPRPLPETLIGHDPRFWLNTIFGGLSASRSTPFSDAAIAEYLRAFGTPEGIHATCEDYRAGATADLASDRADASAGRKITCPTLVLWGARGAIGKIFRPLETWRDLVASPRGRAIDSGHFIPEENPAETLHALRAFFRS